MLTILNVIARNCIPSPLVEPDAQDFYCQKDDFKIVGAPTVFPLIRLILLFSGLCSSHEGSCFGDCGEVRETSWLVGH